MDAAFRLLASALERGGSGVVTVSSTTRAPVTPVVEERRIGEQLYIARHLPGDRPGESRSEYEVRDAAGRTIRQERFTGSWIPLTAADLERELAPAGWRVRAAGTGIAVLDRAGDASR